VQYEHQKYPDEEIGGEADDGTAGAGGVKGINPLRQGSGKYHDDRLVKAAPVSGCCRTIGAALVVQVARSQYRIVRYHPANGIWRDLIASGNADK
jgi:hypothetical protein